MFFILDIMQVTFVTEPFVDLQTNRFNSQGMGTQAKMCNVCCVKKKRNDYTNKEKPVCMNKN